MRLVDLNPRWWAESGRHGQGVTFTSPTGKKDRLAVAFANPLDGGPPIDVTKILALMDAIGEKPWPVPPGVLWTRTGDTFETLSLHPSVDASRSGNWHGVVSNGNC